MLPPTHTYLKYNIFDSSSPAADQSRHISEFSTWRHFAFAWGSEAGSLRVMIDGQIVVQDTNVRLGYNLSAGAAQGVYLALGVNAPNSQYHIPADSYRGSFDQLELWTHELDADQIREDYLRTPRVPEPALRYTFDEGGGDVAANTGSAAGIANLRLGRGSSGRFFNAGGSSLEYTQPVWAPADLPLNASAVGGAPIVRTFRPGSRANVTLTATQSARIASLPSHGALLLDESPVSIGDEVSAGAVLTFAAAANHSSGHRVQVA